jgi:hypothetical protein
VSFIIFGDREVVEVSDTEGEERASAVAASSHEGKPSQQYRYTVRYQYR